GARRFAGQLRGPAQRGVLARLSRSNRADRLLRQRTGPYAAGACLGRCVDSGWRSNFAGSQTLGPSAPPSRKKRTMLSFAYPWLALLLPLLFLVHYLVPGHQVTRSGLRVPFFGNLAALTGQQPPAGVVVTRRGVSV